MALAHISIGSNAGNRDQNIELSLQMIQEKIGRIVSQSHVYESQSWGYEGQNFLNLTVLVKTALKPVEILNANQVIEKEMGRIKIPGRYTDRTIDLDILFYEDLVLNTEKLSIPHPHLQNRLFVLIPLMDISPDFTHPVFHKNIQQLREECADTGWIRKHYINGAL